MSIYKQSRRTKINYRKIYEQYYGPIPRDDIGRKYEIHHIDGNSNNNDPKNLIAISIKDHYNIHYDQKDWAACLRIASKMKLSSDQISEIAKLNHENRIKNKTHPWLTRSDGTSVMKDRVMSSDYINPFSGKNKGTQNSRYDSTIHTFYNVKTDTIIKMTQFEFVTTQDVNQGSASRLINGKYKITRGWTIIK